MARNRVRAAARKAAAAAVETLRAENLDEVEEVVLGVRQTALQVQPFVKAGSLYWTAPLQYVIEQMAPRVCKAHNVPIERVEDVAAYLLSAMNEYVVALVGEFDVEHFEGWTAALERQEGAGG